ncbi:unnamed protein product [Symbiodinium sp. CCMP2592]|nr:unnamed protein product [Symbiodinium sp. CCMP2592]
MRQFGLSAVVKITRDAAQGIRASLRARSSWNQTGTSAGASPLARTQASVTPYTGRQESSMSMFLLEVALEFSMQKKRKRLDVVPSEVAWQEDSSGPRFLRKPRASSQHASLLFIESEAATQQCLAFLWT